jgi:hypothetical protein
MSSYEYCAPEKRIWCPRLVEERKIFSGKHWPWPSIRQSRQAHSAERRQRELSQLWRLGHSCVSSASKRQSHRDSREKFNSGGRRCEPKAERRSRERESEGESEKKEAMGPGRACSTLLSPRLPQSHSTSTSAPCPSYTSTRESLSSFRSENSRTLASGLTARRVWRTHGPATDRPASARSLYPTHQLHRCVRVSAI